MKNPCIICIVRAACTRLCDEKEDYTTFICEKISKLGRGYSNEEMDYLQKLKYHTFEEELNIRRRYIS